MHVLVVLALLALFLVALSAFIRQWNRRNRASGMGCPPNVPCNTMPASMPDDRSVEVMRDVPEDAAVVIEVNPYMPKSCGGAPCSPDMYRSNPPPRAMGSAALHRGPGAVECRSLSELEAACKKDAVVLFHMTGCGPCQAFKPTFFQAATRATVPFFAIDSMAVPDVINRYNLTGFPTVMRFSNGKIVAEYQGNRTEGDLLLFAGNP